MADEKKERVALADEDLDKVAGGKSGIFKNDKTLSMYNFYCEKCKLTFSSNAEKVRCSGCNAILKRKNAFDTSADK